MTASPADATPNPWVSWRYVQDNLGDITDALGQHVGLTLQAVAIATAVAVPLAVVAHLRPRLAGAILGVSGALYTVPSLALFALLYPFLLDARLTVLIGLVMYALLVLVRNVLVGLQGVPEEVRDAARGLGYRRLRMLLTVELPHATPAVVAGLRLATVTTVALVTIGVVVGYGGLGQLLFRGFQSDYHAEILTATVLCVALALVADVLLRVVGHAVTPWLRTRSPR
ncbi:ABC transporter permease subunit [Cellulomonas sp. ATA003]|uniref:ABC transporter permease n=1 Tax=Cellulomonas sp. ATA003 TaxID=3073064 RepID=UPI002873DA38|nr:ABC transporter permease subunit [Cellulomonas sp. ATA003]WNB86710.1 ABC transporter permease subunit [Cellulomonas sp. ATA003]